MKLLRARITNFRLLKDVTIEFATGRDQNLTVIRAANESGKTTLLVALQWGLFGDHALPKGGMDYRLSPRDMPSGTPTSVDVAVEVDWEVPTQTGVRRYKVIRMAREGVRGGEWERGTTNVSLFHLTPRGASSVDNPDAHIAPHLPRELREVFFTDGDRALSFIEGSKGDQMRRVESAIRSLLGFTVVENARAHTRQLSASLNQRVRKDASGRQDLQTASEHLALLEERIATREGEIKKARTRRVQLEDLAEEADTRLADALRKGNREELEKQRQNANRGRKSAAKDADAAAREQANLFRSELLGKHLLAGPFATARSVLKRLHQQGKIPNQTIPVLEDRLRQPTCICGEPLLNDDPDSERRRAHLRHLIEESRKSDAIQEKVTQLYYGAQDLLRPIQERTWSDEYSDVFGRRQRANVRHQEFGEQEASIEHQISEIPDVDTQQLRMTRNRYREQLRDAHGTVMRLEALQEADQRDSKRTEAERAKLLQKDEKSRKIAAEIVVAQDLQTVLTNALETMKTRELGQVSDRMNATFLSMIGADEAQRAIIRRATITPEFRILVFDPNDQPLDPSQDLNGASRRALTIAFVLALTRVSEVEAPNVVDTPLGMMSGYVKQAVLQLAAKESSQLVLFLTHSEIVGCEDLLDQRAGRVYTLTNPAHYPKILVNEPGDNDSGVLLCECNHRQFCKLCERRETASVAE